MNDPNINPLPPIASPHGGGAVPPLPPVGPREWRSAPAIVKGWAYPLTWLAIIVLPIVAIMQATTNADPVEGGIEAFIYFIFWAVEIWLNIGLRKGWRGAWIGQIVISCMGLLAFCLGTAIHGYILSQWFKPEVKAWFGQT